MMKKQNLFLKIGIVDESNTYIESEQDCNDVKTNGKYCPTKTVRTRNDNIIVRLPDAKEYGKNDCFGMLVFTLSTSYAIERRTRSIDVCEAFRRIMGQRCTWSGQILIVSRSLCWATT